MYKGIVLICDHEVDQKNKQFLNHVITQFQNFKFCLVRNFMSDENESLQIMDHPDDGFVELEIKRPKSYKFAVKFGIRALTQGSSMQYVAYAPFKSEWNSQWIIEALKYLEKDESIAFRILEAKSPTRHFEKLSFDLEQIINQSILIPVEAPSNWDQQE